MKATIALALLLGCPLVLAAEPPDCDDYADAHASERQQFDRTYAGHEDRVLNPLRQQIKALDAQLGEFSTLEKQLRNLEKQNRELAESNRKARARNAREAAKIERNRALIEEKRRQSADADAQGQQKRAGRLGNEISQLTRKIGNLEAAIAGRGVKIDDREARQTANTQEIAALEAALARANADQLLQRRRHLGERLDNAIAARETASQRVQLLGSAAALCEENLALRDRLAACR